MSRIVDIPVSRQHAPFTHHTGMQLRSWIGRLNMEGCGGDAVLNGPVYRAPEHVFPVVIHAEDKAAIDHDAQRVQTVCNSLVVAARFCRLLLRLRFSGVSVSKPTKRL